MGADARGEDIGIVATVAANSFTTFVHGLHLASCHDSAASNTHLTCQIFGKSKNQQAHDRQNI
jgi:hypothetical protein